MNVVTDTADGVRVLTASEAQQRIDQLWRKANACMADASRDTAAAARYMREINDLLPVAHPEDVFQIHRYEGPV